MPLVEHLYELRARLGKALLAIAVAVVLVFVFWEPFFALLRAPYCRVAPHGQCQLYATGLFEQFNVRLRVSFLGGIVLASPVWLYQLGAFITPALHAKEKRYAGGFLLASLTLFATGVCFAYLTVDRGLAFLLSVGGDGIVALPTVQSYLSFFTLTLLAFGIAFEFPVLVVFLNLVGLFPVATMRSWRRGMIVGIAIAAAVITPSQDPFTFMFMAIPLYLLYEVAIVLARVRERGQRRRLAAQGLLELPDDVASPLPPPPSVRIEQVEPAEREQTRGP